MTEILIELVKAKNEDVNVNATIASGEDIARCLEHKEDKEHKTSQGIIKINEFFREHTAKNWIDADINKDVHRTLNKIIVRKCVDFCIEC